MNEAVLYPLTALALVWLWRQRSRGYFLVGVLLVFWTIEPISIAVDQVFGHASDPTQSTPIIPFMAGLGLATLLPTVLYLRNLRELSANDREERKRRQ